MLPGALLNSLEGVSGFDKGAFEKVHASGEQITSVRLNPLNSSADKVNAVFPSLATTKIPWAENGFYLNERPSFTFDPLFHAGCYYVQEASSMFLEQALKQHVDLAKPLKVLDLCAAPGGKSTHLQSLLTPASLLVSNEVIKNRNNILIDNIIKWGCSNVAVTQNDPKSFASLPDYFDVIVVDAPCSGSGLFRRDAEAIAEWSLNNVQLCCQRQQRILEDILPALKKGGLLIYSTCSFSKEEDEDIMEGLVKQNMQNIEIKIKEEWGIVKSVVAGNMGYRFYPDKLKGEGFFLTCFKKLDGAEFTPAGKIKKSYLLPKKQEAIVQQWLKSNGFAFYLFYENVTVIPENLQEAINILFSKLRVTYFGTKAGIIIRDKLIPDHALAMSKIISDAIPVLELSWKDAIKYLQRKEIVVEEKQKGWQLVSYNNYPLGWINVLPNRINNYYPKALRILKEANI